MLEYFDAFLIGMTATPLKQTLGFFNQNLVMEYTHDRAVADGVNVDGDIYRIQTEITENGSTIESGDVIGKRNKLTRKERWERTEEPIKYSGTKLDRDVVAEDQIRTVIQVFRLQIIYSKPYGERHITYEQIKQIADAIEKPPYHLTPDLVWQAYEKLEKSRVRGSPQKLLTNIISLVRFAMGESKFFSRSRKRWTRDSKLGLRKGKGRAAVHT